MKTLAVAILAWLQAQPVSKYDASESPEDRSARLAVVARAVSDVAGDDRRLAAFILVDGDSESGWRRDVQECRCPVGQCDWDRFARKARAHGLWQVHLAPTMTTVHWDGFCGIEYSAAERGAKFVRSYYRWKRGNLACAYAALGAVKDCSAPWAVARAKRAEELAGKLRFGEETP